MSRFISCDWGTSNLRIRLVDATTMQVHQELETTDGIASIYRLWKIEGEVSNRIDFYLSILEKQILNWKEQYGPVVKNFPVIISGMASSTIGLTELEYARLPMPANGSALVIRKLETTRNFYNPVFIVSGVCTTDDIMRGEETLLAGCDTLQDTAELFVFPGTHSKHVVVVNGKAESFKTYMSGEFFDILSRHSILSASVEAQDFIQQSFEAGVAQGAKNNLLNSAFKVRVNQVFQKSTAQENFNYLSGLIIGTELREITSPDFHCITIVASDALRTSYYLALKLLNPAQKIAQLNSNIAIVRGHCKIFRNLL